MTKRLPSPAGRKAGDESAAKPYGQFLVYPTEDGRTKIEVRLENETVWLTQQHMADLFQTTQQNISPRLRRKCFVVQTVLGCLQRLS